MCCVIIVLSVFIIIRCVIVPNQSKQQSEPSSMTSEPKSPLKSNDISLSDFGHSLMAGFSDTYLTDFVLHGTSQPLDEFKDSLISDLSSVLKVHYYYITPFIMGV